MKLPGCQIRWLMTERSVPTPLTTMQVEEVSIHEVFENFRKTSWQQQEVPQTQLQGFPLERLNSSRGMSSGLSRLS
ncbi:hypothetical protein J5N97_002146 [Dioscorea zingiberensis]|uniref:Uncharacterized protein n=1 Tax=Dioscorea zingiberensis TaxID=325984 RepID=A0A9D5HNX4_9LILI|nr:hypothetical protein J5N97_002146 [Dioscorea zingiberensis]